MHRVLFILFLFAVYAAPGQEVKVRGGFEGDTVRLGLPIRYTVTAQYPSRYQVLFPDSTFNFAPFEFKSKKYVPTKTLNNLSYDSVVYTLVSFEIDSLQILSLPVFQVQKRDSLVYHTDADTVFFSAMVENIPDSLAINQLPLKTNTAYNKVSWILNYPVLLIIGGILLVVAILVWIVFGKRIRKHFVLKRLMKKHNTFITLFDQAVEKLSQTFSPDMAERSITLWKKYMEELSDRPYTKYTSKEIRELEKGELTQALQAVDRMIYARLQPESLSAFEQLKIFTVNRFNQKLQEVKHG
ncbi:MAG: hypothetical protein KIT62_17025 [Cyclobacteriaceae bacterium]|nr:hypothetical protein [Cyclobacteriaceae bacterium]